MEPFCPFDQNKRTDFYYSSIKLIISDMMKTLSEKSFPAPGKPLPLFHLSLPSHRPAYQ
jgi:hypothetical protein